MRLTLLTCSIALIFSWATYSQEAPYSRYFQQNDLADLSIESLPLPRTQYTPEYAVPSPVPCEMDFKEKILLKAEERNVFLEPSYEDFMRVWANHLGLPYVVFYKGNTTIIFFNR